MLDDDLSNAPPQTEECELYGSQLAGYMLRQLEGGELGDDWYRNFASEEGVKAALAAIDSRFRDRGHGQREREWG